MMRIYRVENNYCIEIIETIISESKNIYLLLYYSREF